MIYFKRSGFIITTIFSGEDLNFPKDETDLNNRLDIIRKGLPNQGDNINPFVKPAFTLFKDCGLIEPEVIQELSEKWLCGRLFGEKAFPLGGVLRHQDLNMFDNAGHLRYYSEKVILCVSLEGVRYYISNHWTAQNKKLFFNWLSAKAKQVCQKKWSQNPIVPPQPPIKENSFQILINKIEELEEINRNLCYHIPNLESRIQNLEKKLDNLITMIENVEEFLTKPEKSN